MSDEHNVTIGPAEARRARPRAGMTQNFQAIQAQKAERAASDPARAMLESVGGKAIGLALLYWAQGEWARAAKTEGHFDEWAAIGAAVVGLYFVMPTTMRALLSLVRPLLPWQKRNGAADG